MESPATWDKATRLVNDLVTRDRENRAKPPNERIIGLSLAGQITMTLRNEGLLKTEYADENVHRLLKSLEKLHERTLIEIGYDDPLFICKHCNVPAPCPTMMDVHDIEEYVL